MCYMPEAKFYSHLEGIHVRFIFMFLYLHFSVHVFIYLKKKQM